MFPLLSRLRLPFFVIVLMFSVAMVACVRPVPDIDAPPTIPPPAESNPPDTLPLTSTVDTTSPLTDTVLPPGSVPSGTITIPLEGEGEGDGEGQNTNQPTDPETTPPSTTPETEAVTGPPPSTHVVQTGETLLTISQIYGVTVDDIAVANGLDNINILSVGQELTIPEPGFAENQTAQPPAEEGAEGGETVSPPTAEQIHVVQRGDTLYSIGRAYGFTIDELVAYNNLVNPDALQIGDEIRIPPTP